MPLSDSSYTLHSLKHRFFLTYIPNIKAKYKAIMRSRHSVNSLLYLIISDYIFIYNFIYLLLDFCIVPLLQVIGKRAGHERPSLTG